MSNRVYSIESVTLSLQKSLPPNLLIEAFGRTATSGWSNLTLVPHVYVTIPMDGIQGYDMLGQPPASGQIVLQVLTRVSADFVIPSIDIANYWGTGKPLEGVRCHAQSNAKTALFNAPQGMLPVAEVMDHASSAPFVPSFQRDIRPLFRQNDVTMMIAVRNLDLSAHADVTSHAELIYERLLDGSMPCDGSWPNSDIEIFRRWIDLGLQD